MKPPHRQPRDRDAEAPRHAGPAPGGKPGAQRPRAARQRDWQSGPHPTARAQAGAALRLLRVMRNR